MKRVMYLPLMSGLVLSVMLLAGCPAPGDEGTNLPPESSPLPQWTLKGAAGFSEGEVDYVNLALDSNNTPYVAYTDRANGDKATVMKFNGDSWEAVGGVGFSEDKVYRTSLALDSNDTPYVAYRDHANGGKATVTSYE